MRTYIYSKLPNQNCFLYVYRIGKILYYWAFVDINVPNGTILFTLSVDNIPWMGEDSWLQFNIFPEDNTNSTNFEINRNGICTYNNPNNKSVWNKFTAIGIAP